ncbi:unnamed protein product [Lactuca saligna]|uniref:Adenosine kinase n=1 Tax=Lactuca saligna TaxID=75948 RepID=A0AA35V1Y7_LACSI|nr:unnamed protein product [Lactuca saligna]
MIRKARAFFQELTPIALLYCSFSLQLPFLSFSLRQTLSLLLSSRRRQLLPPPTFLLVLGPPTSDLRLAPPHRPTLSSVTQPMEPLIFGNLTLPALASNIRSGDLRVTASIAQIYKPYVLLRYVYLDSNFSMFLFFYKILMAPLLSIFVMLVFVLHVASESTREVVEQIDGEEFTGNQRIGRWLKKAKYIYIAGFFLTVSPESIQLVAEHVAAANKFFTINLSTPFICEFSKDAQEKALPYVDYVFRNETEARTFSKVHGWETDNVEEIAIDQAAPTLRSLTLARFLHECGGYSPFQYKEISAPLKAPKWYQCKAGVSFGFGGKLARFFSHNWSFRGNSNGFPLHSLLQIVGKSNILCLFTNMANAY